MNKFNITGTDLQQMGFPQGEAIAKALQVIERHYQAATREQIVDMLTGVIENPEAFREHAYFAPVAARLL